MRRQLVGVVVLTLVLAGGAAAQETSGRQSLLGQLQRIELSESGAWWLTFGGNARLRGESWNGYNFGAPASADPNDAHSLGRFILNVNLHAGSAFRLFVEGKSSIASDRGLVGGRRTQDEDALDLQQGYAELTLPRLGQAALQWRVGRQELALGRERLVSPSDWSNARRTFEGGTVRLGAGPWSIVGLAVAPVTVQSYAFNHRDPHTVLYGVYTTNAKLAARLGLGGQNLVDLSAGASLKWHGVAVIALGGHRFARASRGDAFYGGTLSVTRGAGSGLARHIGDELDLTGRYPVGRHLLVVAGYSHYFPGAFVTQTGASREISFTYLSTQLTL